MSQSNSSRNILIASGVTIIALMIAYGAFAWRQSMENDFKNSDAGRAAAKLAQTKADTEKLAVSTPGATVGFWGVSGAPVAAVQVSPAPQVVQSAIPVNSGVRTGESQRLSTAPCGGITQPVYIGSNDVRVAEGGATGGCLVVTVTGPVTFTGNYYNVFLAGDPNTHVYNVELGGHGAAQALLNSHIGREFVIEILTHNGNYGFVRFN